MNGLPQRTTTPRRFGPVADMTEWDRRYAKGWKAGSPTTFLNPITPGATADMERMQLLFQRWVPDRSRVLCVAHADGSNQRCTYQAFESFFDRQRISAQVTIPGWVPEFWRSWYLRQVVGSYESRFPADWPLCCW